MQIKRNAKVVTADGRDVGHVERVVIDPGTRDLSHLIVSRGWLFKEDRVVPFNLVAHTTEDEIRLSVNQATLEPLPQFQETAYVPAEDGDTGYATPYFAYPLGLSGAPTALPVPHPDVVSAGTRANIPDASVALKEGAGIISADGEHVGDIEQVILDGTTGRATHFVVVSGLFTKEHRLIPHVWVKDVTENEVRLYVNADVIRRLRTQEAATR